MSVGYNLSIFRRFTVEYSYVRYPTYTKTCINIRTLSVLTLSRESRKNNENWFITGGPKIKRFALEGDFRKNTPQIRKSPGQAKCFILWSFLVPSFFKTDVVINVALDSELKIQIRVGLQES